MRGDAVHKLYSKQRSYLYAAVLSAMELTFACLFLVSVAMRRPLANTMHLALSTSRHGVAGRSEIYPIERESGRWAHPLRRIDE
jgi:hypothetical protein